MKQVALGVTVTCLLVSIPASAQERRQCTGGQLGTWALQSYTSQVVETGEKRYPLGEHPSGFLTYGTDCRMTAVLVRGQRATPSGAVATEAEKAQLYDGLMAYSGAYTVDGDRIRHMVDVSWNQVWTGTTQVRQFVLEGDRLTIKSAPAANPIDPRVTTVGALVWTKVR